VLQVNVLQSTVWDVMPAFPERENRLSSLLDTSTTVRMSNVTSDVQRILRIPLPAIRVFQAMPIAVPIALTQVQAL
jgi:hypothetical protein